MGASLTLCSRLGEGSTFTLSIAIAPRCLRAREVLRPAAVPELCYAASGRTLAAHTGGGTADMGSRPIAVHVRSLSTECPPLLNTDGTFRMSEVAEHSSSSIAERNSNEGSTSTTPVGTQSPSPVFSMRGLRVLCMGSGIMGPDLTSFLRDTAGAVIDQVGAVVRMLSRAARCLGEADGSMAGEQLR